MDEIDSSSINNELVEIVTDDEAKIQKLQDSQEEKLSKIQKLQEELDQQSLSILQEKADKKYYSPRF